MSVVALPEQPQPTVYSGIYDQEEESPRGAVLGWVAATVILLIIAAFVWAAVLSDATRDRFTSIF